MMDLSKIGLRFSALSGRMFLCRFGKDANLALDKRDAEREVMEVVTSYMMHDSPKGSSKKYAFGRQWYELTVKPCEPPQPEKDE